MRVIDPAIALRRSVESPETFAVFYDEYFSDVLTYIARRVVEAEVALDLAAESFAQAYLSRSRFRGTERQQAAAWIYRIAQRQVSRYLKRGRLERRALSKLGIDVPDLDEEQRLRIEEMAGLEGWRAVLRVELSALPEKQHQALLLRIVDELPYAEIAKRLQISEEAARLRVSRGLRRLTVAVKANPRSEELRAW